MDSTTRRRFFLPRTPLWAVPFLFLASCMQDGGGAPPMGMMMDDVGRNVSSLTRAERRVRAGQIRDAAFAAGITQGWLLAGIADAETQMSHCWSELTWACKGPNSPDCGGGPVVAGAGDGPCHLRQGGIGMFQFDAGTFDDTLRREGNRVLYIAGNTEAAVDFVASMVVRSVYVSGVSNRAQAIEWMNGVRIGNGRWDPWIKTVTHYYNGCIPSYSCWGQRYAHYRDHTSGVYNEMGADFWVGSAAPGGLMLQQPGAYAPPSTTDVDGDGRADVCARGSVGIWCWLSRDGAWEGPTTPVPWSDAAGWNDVNRYATLRMGDIDGDGLADVCGRDANGVRCATSNGAGFNADTVWRDGLSDANGWNHPKYYTTLRLADVNGDGREDLCARDKDGFGCWLSDGTRFDRRIEGPNWADAGDWDAEHYYGTIRMGDINGDRRADVCARGWGGVQCWLASGDGFPTEVVGPRWGQTSGWGEQKHWSTIRMADVNGDGRQDLCGRDADALRCAFANADGMGFGEPIEVGALSDASGWDDVANYATLRTGDVEGNGTEDLCIRSNSAMICYGWDGGAFVRHDGPAWSDASGWDQPRQYQTLQLADIDGDGLADICGRSASGWGCHLSLGGSFGELQQVGDMHDAGGWTAPEYWTTIMTGSRSCRSGTEACNGLDDDCDGAIDEHGVAEICNGVDDDCDGAVDEHAGAEVCNGRDDDCDGEVDEGLSCVLDDGGVVIGPDGGVLPGTGIDGGCSVGGPGSITPLAPFGLAMLLLVGRRRRR